MPTRVQSPKVDGSFGSLATLRKIWDAYVLEKFKPPLKPSLMGAVIPTSMSPPLTRR